MNRGTPVPITRAWRTFAAIFALIFVVHTNARAMVINITYDSSITGLGNAAQFEGAINNAANTFQVLYTNNIVVNITAAVSNIDLGESQFSLVPATSYSQLTNFLRAARTTSADSNSVASLPAIDPTGGGSWYIPIAETKALGGVLGVPTNNPSSDGTVIFSSTVVYTYDPTNRAVSGKSDLMAVAEHEISEVLGRCYSLGFGISGGYVPYDLFRFTNSGARSLNVTDTNVYFSVDKGVSALSYFYPDYTSGDPQDWQTHNPADAYDAYLTDGDEGYIYYADLTALDVLGYALNFHAPKLTAIRNSSGKIQLNFTNVTGLNFSILATTNIAMPLTNWPVLGRPIETSIGNYQYTDSNTNKARFYRAVLN